MEGGAHEMGLRPGTENLPAIIGFAKAAEVAYSDFEKKTEQIKKMRDRLAEGLLKIDKVFYNGPKNETLDMRLSNNVDITFQYIEGEAILMHLTLRDICVSSLIFREYDTISPHAGLPSVAEAFASPISPRFLGCVKCSIVFCEYLRAIFQTSTKIYLIFFFI